MHKFLSVFLFLALISTAWSSARAVDCVTADMVFPPLDVVKGAPGKIDEDAIKKTVSGLYGQGDSHNIAHASGGEAFPNSTPIRQDDDAIKAAIARLFSQSGSKQRCVY